MMDAQEPEWYDPALLPVKVGRVLYGLERQRAIDNFMALLLAERATTEDLEGFFVDYVNSYRRRRHGGIRRKKKAKYTLERSREVHHPRRKG